MKRVAAILALLLLPTGCLTTTEKANTKAVCGTLLRHAPTYADTSLILVNVTVGRMTCAEDSR